ncbi:transposase [Streptomyces somaliensis DSM 40738]|uniref:Transposase n=1 Tax=Streptomyces somaliensis (strain ATCC 33201 / DSM 40738 / JCM 12659 / KCTC 9044 / NCTC 11332 / NRRL B-12077 / IP 733) TaxID=1134445 RepID=A0AA44DEB0_STRE0|nr:NF041680 family putative transposase [Streptomyces somaliensis]MCQ0022539.1 transposase [Streptomyces somaliensis DSM 40738]NKY14720.1 transposase [Streptomyces somaliensis DSM 40738]
MSLPHRDARPKASAQLSRFRDEFYSCLTARSDALFELADAVLCGDGPVRSLAELSLVGECRRGHGGIYAALAQGRVDANRLRRALAAVPLPRAADGRLVLAVDVTCWLRPDAHTSPERLLCHTYGRGKNQHIPVPGWPYSIVCALEPGSSSWTAPLDALRLAPGNDTATVTARQLRELVERLIGVGQWQAGDPDILIIADAGYDAPRLAFLLNDLPVQVLARMRSDRVLRRPAPDRRPHTRGRPPRHGGEFVFGQPDTWGAPDTETVTQTRLYGTAIARSWDRLHPRLTHRSSWAVADGILPVIEGTAIRLEIEHLPSGATPEPVWLWWSGTGADTADTDRLWQAYLRRFDIEHTFRLFKQTLGWTSPKIRTPQAADRWTWLVLATYTQLRLARPLAADRRRPWEKPLPADRLTPARVRRDFRHIRPTTACPAQAPKPSRPGPGRPPGRQNTRLTPRHDVHTPHGTQWKTPRPKKPTTSRPRRTG